jgi:sugar phosphate isomerase/epimerase
MDVDVIRIGPRTDAKALEHLLKFAGDIGATNLVFTSLSPVEYTAADEHETAKQIAEVCDAAQRYQVRPIVEFIPFRGISSLADSLRIAKLVDHPNFAICVDVLHLCRSGGSPAELAAADPRLLACIQLCDAPLVAPADLPKESRYDRLYPGDGELPLLDLLRAVPADMPVSVEVPNAAAQATRSPLERAQAAANSARRVLAEARALRRS